MTPPGFEWDPAKAVDNERKHGVSFIEACSAFEDDHALLIDDPDQSGDEDRFILMGRTVGNRVLVVAHSYHDEVNVIRIISARRAGAVERARYQWQKRR